MYEKTCPSCSNVIQYKTKGALVLSEKKQSKCRKCASKFSGFTDRYATKGKNIGEDNAFYGKTVSEENKQKIGKINKNRIITDSFRQKMSQVTKGYLNPMFGKTYYEIWVEKYGKEEADKREIIKKTNNSKSSSGKNNPMYGRPSPGGSGYGWKGWYKDCFFRSLRELSYMIYLDETNQKWISAETKELTIEYKDCFDKDRTYRADFLVNDVELIEIKPKRLHSTSLCQQKKKFAEEFCAKHKLQYKLIDIEIKQQSIIDNLNHIRWQKNYGEKFDNYVADENVARSRKKSSRETNSVI